MGYLIVLEGHEVKVAAAVIGILFGAGLELCLAEHLADILDDELAARRVV